MDKKNVDTSLERPSFFEVFKAQCSDSDLGPISINWFEELSSETPLYDLENSEDLEHITSCVNQNTFKTPKGKLSTNTQLASTPMIFKEQSKTLPQFASALKELDQSKGKEGRCHHPTNSVDTSLDQSDVVVSSFNTCLLASPLYLRKKWKTPPSNKCVLNESLLRTPKLFEAQTQKCISESLGVEVDPEMSWSSSLATPPTLSPTVLLARGNDTVSGTKPHDERIPLIMHNLFTKYCGSPAKNSVCVQSTIEDLHTKLDSELTDYEKPMDGSFDICRSPRKSNVNQKPLEVEDMHDTGKDSGISICLASDKAFLRKVKTVTSSQKKIFEVEQEETEEAIKVSEELSITESERQMNNCKCNLQGAIIYNNRMQTFRENQNDIHTENEMLCSTLSPWSQLDLSGLEITQLEKVSSCCSGGSSILNVEKSSEKASSTNKVCEIASPLESCVINTADLIKTDNLINTCSSEKPLLPENSSVPTAIVKKSSTPVKVCKDEHAFAENVSETGSLLIENTTSTDPSETPKPSEISCFHIHSKENCKVSSDLPIDNVLTPVATDDEDLTKSGLPTRKSLSNLKRRPKKFIYTINNTPLCREERTNQKDGPSAFHVSPYTDFKSCIAEVSASRNEGKTEDTLSFNKHIIEEKQEVGSEDTGLSLFPQTEKEKTVVLSKAANQEIEPSEQKLFAVNSKDILEKDNRGKCSHPAHLISLPEASKLKMGNNQEVLELGKQHSSPSGNQLAELGKLTKETPAPGILKKNVDSGQSEPLDLKENVEDSKPRWLGNASSRKIQVFDGFKTASNKKITVSDINTGKGKLLFKDIEDEFLEDFPTKRIQNISSQNLQENTENSLVVRNNLNRKRPSNFSQVSDFQMNFNKCSDAQNIFPAYANLFFQNVPKNLTASQEAEITELSNILEETGSQFELTQFKEQRTLLYNNLEVSESIDKNEINKLDLNSEVWKDIDFDECIRTKVQQSNYLSPRRHTDTTEKSEAQRQSREEFTSINSLTGNLNKAHFAPSVSAPLQPHLSDLGKCCSVVNTEVNLSDEITNKAPKTVSRMGEMLDLHKTYFQCGLSERSNSSCWNNSRYMKGIDAHHRVKEVNAEYVLKNNANDTITFVKENISKDTNVNENVIHISRTTEVNLKIVQKYSLHMTGNQLSSIENNRSILVSHHFTNCDETQCKYNLQETLSDLTCLAEVTKTEKNYLNDADEKENINSNQDQEKMNTCANANSRQNVHTGVDGDLFAEKNNNLLFAGSCQREDLNNIPSSERAGVSNRKGDITSVRKSIDLNKNKINYQEGPDIKKRKQNSAMGFYTASGKQVTVSDESLVKARHLLSEQNTFPQKEDVFWNLVKPGIQASTKDNKDEKITTVREEIGERTERHWGKVLNSQSDFEDSLQTANPETIKDLSLETNALRSDFISQNGNGKECNINEGLLAKNNQTCKSSKNDISKMVFIDSVKEEHFHVEEGPSIYEKQNIHNLSIRNTRSILEDECNEKNSVSDNLIHISHEASSKRVNAEKNSGSFGNISENDSHKTQKCLMKSLHANTLQKNSPGQREAPTPKPLKTGPITFTTASGKTVGVSEEALTKTKELFHSNCCKPIKQNAESHSETRKHNTLNSCRDVMSNRKCAVSTNRSSVENSVISQIPRMGVCCYEDEQALQHSRSASLNHGPESSLCFQMDAEHSNTWIANKFCDSNADISTANCGFFSTASGKPVKISEESLRKSKQLFSEIEYNNSSKYQSSVSDCNYASDASSVRDKVTPQKNKLPFQGKKPANFEVNTSISCGFSTASGKQMQISEKAFQKAMGLIKEFDDISSNCCTEDKHMVGEGHISPIKSSSEADDEILSKSKLKEKCNAVNLTSNCTEKKDLVSTEVPMCVSHTEKYKQATEQEHNLPSAKEMEPLEMNLLSSTERKCVAKCNIITKGKLNLHSPTYSQIRDSYLETEASESAKAFMQDDDLTDTEVEKNKKSSFVCEKISNFRLNTRTGKRQMEEQHTFGEPPIKRKLLPEFDQSERHNNPSFKTLKSTPDGTVNDRRKFTYNISLKPEICDPFRKPLTEESRKKENHVIAKKPVKVFVPPFKTKSGVSEDEMGNNKECVLLASKNIDGKEELNSAKFPTTTTKLENELLEKDTAPQISVVNSIDEDLTKIIENLHSARNLQEIRILKKKRQRICPHPGSLYLMKMAAAGFRVPLKDAVEDKPPSFYSSEQLYSLGVSKQCMQVNSRNAEDFQFLIQEFFSREYFLEKHGILLADGGYLIPTNEGKAGKEEFYQALCDTPGVDPKLISKAWVYNHYRWIVWKLAAMEVAFPREFANKCLTPERVLLQLKYRYDIEVDRSHRSAIKRITERDDVAAKTLILCISKIISLSTNMSHGCDNKNIVEESPPKVAAVEVTDGWYGIRAILDPPLQSLLCKDKLAVGHKIIVHGAELIGPQDASTPLEAPESLMLKISANSTRRTRWYSKLGYHWDPRPFCVPLSSLFSDGGTVSCVDVVVQRVYPIQWMEKISVGSYVFRNCRAEEREAAKHAENRQKMHEALLAKIQAEFEKSEGESKRAMRSRTLTRQQIRSLQDGAELYEAVLNAADPADMEGYFSNEQLKALNSYRQMVNEQRQAQIEAEFRKAVESAEHDEHTCCKRDVIPILKLRIIDCRKEERRKEVILNIWRPSSHVCTLLKEGGRFRIFHLTASQSKDRSETANLQLTATKKTQYLQLPVSQEVLSHVYKPRQSLQFSRLLEPSFQPTCSEVDLVGFIICLRKGTGFSTLLYLSDENRNLIAVQINSDLKLLAIEDIVIPSTLISATNLQWRPEYRSCIPTLFAGERSAFSSNPKESHLQGALNELRNVVKNDSCFGKEVQQRLMDLLPADSPQVFNLPKEYGSDPFPSPWKPGSGNKNMISTCSNERKCPSSLTLGKPLVSLSSTKFTQELQETPKNYKKRKAIELLSQVPSPPPVKPICTLVSPLVKRAFQPPRSSALQHERPLEARYCQSMKKPALKTARETGFPFENNFIADEELAMINTQALLTNSPEDKEGVSTDQMEYAGRSDLPSRPLLRNKSSQSADRKNIIQNSHVGTDASKSDKEEINSVAVQKKLQRQRKQKN